MMNKKWVDKELTAQMQRAADEYFAALGEHLLTEAQIMNSIERKGGIVVKKKVSTFAVVFAMVLLLGSVALAAGLGVFGSFMGREDHELSDLRLEKLDTLAVTLGETREFKLPGEAKDEAGLTDIEKALNRLAGRSCTLTLDQAYCDGHRLYYSYTLKLDKPSETVFGEGEPTGEIDWAFSYPDEFAEARLHNDGPDGEIAKWLTEHEVSFAARDSISLGDGAWLGDDSLMIFDSDQQWLDDTTLQGYQEVRLPEGFEAGESLDVRLPVCFFTWFVYQDAEGMKAAYLHDEQSRGTVFVPMTVPVTGKTHDLSGEIKKDDYTASAEITVSEVDVFGEVTLTDVQDTTGSFIRDYQLVAGDEVLRNVEGGLSDIVDGRYAIGLRFDLPQNTDNLALRPIDAQDASEDILLK